MIKNIGIVGYGNVAWHYGHALIKAGYSIQFVAGRNAYKSEHLASLLKSNATATNTSQSCDMVIYAVSDSVLEQVINNSKIHHRIAVHTSGSLPVGIFNGIFENYGVLYPYQSLTKGVEVEFLKVPLCVEANNAQTCQELLAVAKVISHNVHNISTEQRKILHLTGVIANNFSNYLYGIAHGLLEVNNIDPEIINPIIQETAQKLQKSKPSEAQTGPARRNNQNIIDIHLELLKDYPDIQQLYSLISGQIVKKYHK